MPKFKYTATAADGSTVRGVQEAATATQARNALAARSLLPVEITEKRGALRLELTKKKVPRKELMHFSRQLAVFVRAGIPLIDGLETIAAEVGNKTFHRVLHEMADDLRAGMTFGAAAAAHPNAFPEFYLGILRSAEMTGNLDMVLDQLSGYIERDLTARQKIRAALIYPFVVFIMALVSVGVLLTFVLPKFTEFFQSLDAELPLPTRIMISGGDFFGEWWWALGGGMLVGGLLAAVVLRTEGGKLQRDRLLLGLPLIGGLTQYAVLERFCRILSSMASAGVPLPDALAVTGEATNNRVFRRGVAQARELMLQGQGLSQPLASTGLFPAAARQMFQVGESTGTLDSQMATAASYFDRELEYKLKRFTSLFEPAVIIVSGAVIGFIAISLVSAMYGIFRQVEF